MNFNNAEKITEKVKDRLIVVMTRLETYRLHPEFNIKPEAIANLEAQRDVLEFVLGTKNLQEID